MAGHRRAVRALLQRADVGRQFLGQHRHHAVGEIDAVAARPRLAVELGAGADVETDVGDRDDRVPAALAVGLGPDRVVMVARVLGIDRDDRQMRQVLACRPSGIFATRCASSIASCANSARSPCLWIAISEKLRGANGSPSTASTRADHPRRAAGDLAQHEVAGFGVLQLADRQLAPLFLVDRRQPEALALAPDHAQRQLGRALEFLQRMRDPALALLLGPRTAPGRRSRARSCRARARAAAAAGVSACHCSGTANTWPLSSTWLTRSTVTLGTPPAWWNARPREWSISPSSAMSLSSALSSILSCPDSPNARAISRFPAGWSDEAMKSRICLRDGQAGGALA